MLQQLLPPVLFCMVFIRMMVLPAMFTLTTVSFPAALRTVAAKPVMVSIPGNPISDRQGNVIGVTIPLKRAGRLLLLEGTIDNLSGNFILDTGASGLVLNKTYFRNASTIYDEESGGVTGSTELIGRIFVKRLDVSDLIFSNLTADVTPLGHLENRRGVKILGLFGMSLLKDLEMVLDVSRNELQLYKLDKSGTRMGPTKPVVKYDIIQKIESYHNILIVKATIAGRILDFCLDTGAESNVLSISANKKVLGTVTIKGRSSLNGVGRYKEEILFGNLNDFSMGNRQLLPMETIVCSLTDISQKYGYPIDGILGYDFFAKGKIYINPVQKIMGICLTSEDRK
jgi:predicted aspartyl protease